MGGSSPIRTQKKLRMLWPLSIGPSRQSEKHARIHSPRMNSPLPPKGNRVSAVEPAPSNPLLEGNALRGAQKADLRARPVKGKELVALVEKNRNKVKRSGPRTPRLPDAVVVVVVENQVVIRLLARAMFRRRRKLPRVQTSTTRHLLALPRPERRSGEEGGDLAGERAQIPENLLPLAGTILLRGDRISLRVGVPVSVHEDHW